MSDKIDIQQYHVPLVDDTEPKVNHDSIIDELGEQVNNVVKLIDELPQSNYADVGNFMHKFGLPNATNQGVFPREVDSNFMKFRSAFMHEELREFDEALAAGDLLKAFDALLDLAYVTFGTAQILGLPWQAGWTEVQRANMAKVRASPETQGTRPWQFDVLKPEGWQPPDLKTVLERFGWSDDLLKFPPINVRSDEKTTE
jgi:predicted HAD superfamily Cof-like phosphohydrolase